MQKNIHNYKTHTKLPIYQNLQSLPTHLLVRWVPTPKAHLRWRTTLGCERSYSDQGRSCPAVLGQNALVPPGKVVPRRCRWHLRAQSGSPALAECIGRGPTRFRAMAGKIRPVTGTCRKIHIITKRTEIYQYIKTCEAYRLTSWCAGFPHPRRTSDGERPSVAKDPTRIRAALVPPFLARMH